MIETVRQTTDAQGKFRAENTINPPGPSFMSVDRDISARIVSPAGIGVRGVITIQNKDGVQMNSFELEYDAIAENKTRINSGNTDRAGKWSVSLGDNTISVVGETFPPTPNTEVVVEVEA